jgi:hypothetical protein
VQMPMPIPTASVQAPTQLSASMMAMAKMGNGMRVQAIPDSTQSFHFVCRCSGTAGCCESQCQTCSGGQHVFSQNR